MKRARKRCGVGCKMSFLPNFSCFLKNVYGCLSISVCVPHMCPVPIKVRRRQQTPGIRVTDDYKSLCGCWDSNLVPLEEQSVFLITEPSHPCVCSGCY